ncbi:hypothetical protein ANO11243_061800 [Dothideomycetidae sp. 11243]|nr:hypothetical protein ANO11243_061800 [fungal sp. No.11243]
MLVGRRSFTKLVRHHTSVNIQPGRDMSLAQSKQQDSLHMEQVEHVDSQRQLEGVDAEDDPKLTARTWVALVAFFFLNYTQVVALQGPAAVLNYIGTDLHNNRLQAWIVVTLSLTQGVLGPVISNASDVFQARKLLLVVCCAISFIGACIAPSSNSVDRLIGSSVLIGVGFATVPLAYAVPSEILPRRWRPLVQSGVNSAAVLATISAPFTIAALTKRNPHTGWRDFYWFQAACWGFTTLALVVGYQPPKRRTEVEKLSFWRKLASLDLIGSFLPIAGLTLFLVGLSLGGGLYSWKAVPTLCTLIVGLIVIVVFGLYEWKGTSTGILNHDLFRKGTAHPRTLVLLIALLALEAIMIFGYSLFFPILSQLLFTSDPVLVVLRSQACWIPALFSTVFWSYLSTRFRTIREPLFAGFLVFTGGLIGMCTLQPGQSSTSIGLSVMIGIGFGAPLSLIVAGIQLSAPHKLIATATACVTSSRAITGAVFSAINAAAFDQRIAKYLPEYVAKAALTAGLPANSVPAFIGALSTGDSAALAKIPGVTPIIIGQGVEALKQAYVDAIRVIFIIAAPFGVVACIACWFIQDLKKTMNYHVDAPMVPVLKDEKASEMI